MEKQENGQKRFGGCVTHRGTIVLPPQLNEGITAQYYNRLHRQSTCDEHLERVQLSVLDTDPRCFLCTPAQSRRTLSGLFSLRKWVKPSPKVVQNSTHQTGGPGPWCGFRLGCACENHRVARHHRVKEERGNAACAGSLRPPFLLENLFQPQTKTFQPRSSPRFNAEQLNLVQLGRFRDERWTRINRASFLDLWPPRLLVTQAWLFSAAAFIGVSVLCPASARDAIPAQEA